MSLSFKGIIMGAMLATFICSCSENGDKLQTKAGSQPADVNAGGAMRDGTMKTKIFATLSFSDSSPSATDLDSINKILHAAGVHLSQVALPQEAALILGEAYLSKLNEDQQAKILKIFALSREDLLDQIKIAGRQPAIPGGGSLSTREAGVPPYPKIYDMRAMSPQDFINAQNKFGKLHVNSAENGQGVDEVMTLVSGGPWTWFFLLKENVVGKLTLSSVPTLGPAWRLSYPGLTPHGAFMNAEQGVCVAYICGPETWLMRYEAPQIKGGDMLGKNPWVDFSDKQPVLLDVIRK